MIAATLPPAAGGRANSADKRFGCRTEAPPRSQNGYRLRPIGGSPFTWQNPTNDPRALNCRARNSRLASPVVGSIRRDVAFEITPPDNKPYRLTAYLLDFDHDRRAAEVKILDATGVPLDLQTVSREETDRGVYLTWTVSGKVRLVFNRTSGTNVSVSGIFIDADRHPSPTQK